MKVVLRAATAVLVVAFTSIPLTGFPLVAKRIARAVIVIPADATPQRRATAKLLQDYVRRSTGVTVAIQDHAGAMANLLIGRSPQVDHAGLDLESLSEDGFVLQQLDSKTYVAAGRSEWGTEFAVVEILERCLGVRWLFPGDDGMDVPNASEVELPAGPIRREPAYKSRVLSGLPNAVQSEWARRNRMHGDIAFHHNLLHLFPPSKYAATHPEFFPILGGKRYIPTDDNDPSWQPNLSAPGIVDEAVKNIEEYFRTHPDAQSYSLGINDSGRWDESPASLARESGAKNFLGLRDVSDSYYGFCNDVVERVLRDYPDKYFGLLAYLNVIEPPKFKLNSHIVPFITYDRMKWVKPSLASAGHSLNERWESAATSIGWYDYAYGSPYCVPRVYPHEMADYLRYGNQHRVAAHYAELYPNWGEGPKPYVYLRLQWDPNDDVDALLNEWYVRAVGPRAAPLLRDYYGIWERFWTRTAPATPWWTDDSIFLRFTSPNYLAYVDFNDLARSRQLLDRVISLSATDAQKRRARMLARAFDYYDASARAFDRATVIRVDAPPYVLLNTAAAESAYVAKRRELLRAFATDPVLVQPLDPDKYFSDENWGLATMWAAYDVLRGAPSAMARLREMSVSASEPIGDTARAMLAVIGGSARPVSKNGRFEDGIRDWLPWKEGSATVDVIAGHRTPILIVKSGRGGVAQTVGVADGLYVAVAHIRADDRAQEHAEVAVILRDESGAAIRTITAQARPVTGLQTVGCVARVGKDANEARIATIVFAATAANSEVGCEDVTLYAIPPTVDR